MNNKDLSKKVLASLLTMSCVYLGGTSVLPLVEAAALVTSADQNITLPADGDKRQEFIDLNPKAMTPVAWWMLHEETVYKGGDTVTLNETDLTQIPKVIEYCKKNPQKNLYTFKNQASNDVPN